MRKNLNKIIKFGKKSQNAKSLPRKQEKKYRHLQKIRKVFQSLPNSSKVFQILPNSVSVDTPKLSCFSCLQSIVTGTRVFNYKKIGRIPEWTVQLYSKRFLFHKLGLELHVLCCLISILLTFHSRK